MADRDSHRAEAARRRLDSDKPLYGSTQDSHDAARRHLERRSPNREQNRELGSASNRVPNRASARVPYGRLDAHYASSYRKASRRPWLCLGASALVVVLVVVVAITLLAGQGGSDVLASEEAASEAANQTLSVQDTKYEDPYADVVADLSLVPDDLDEELLAELEALAASDGRVAYIINTIGTAFGDNESSELAKLLKLVVDDSESIDFVLGLADNYPQEEGQPYDEEVEAGTVPLLLQWDERWGYTRYCAMSFAAAGCGPTSFAMVYMGITGDTSLTPYDMGVYATEHGYAVDYEGTIGASLFSALSAELGLNCISFSPDASTLKRYLSNGYVVIGRMGPGDFTTTGHFIVITGLNDEGELIVNDPYSTVRSAQTWDVDLVVSQARTFFAFSAA